MSDRTIDEEEVRRQHLEEVRPGMHWLYLVAVVLGSFILMVGLIALLGATV